MAARHFSIESMEETVPKAPWVHGLSATNNDRSWAIPQAIGHRGYKASWPENSMAAFKGAVKVGAHAVETDLHLSADGVIVLSHDNSLKRCFGVDKKVHDLTWDELSELRTKREPKQPVARLSELLAWLAEPEQERVWLLLDVKIDDNPEELIAALVKTIDEAPAPIPWKKRLVVACWNATFLSTACRLLPGYPLAITSFSVFYARHFLSLPNVHFNVLAKALAGPVGARFLADAQRAGRAVFAWTVNDEPWMEWCVRRNRPAKRIDAVICDDPAAFLSVCERLRGDSEAATAAAKRGSAGGGPGVVSAVNGGARLLVVHALLGVLYLLARFAWGRLDMPRISKR